MRLKELRTSNRYTQEFVAFHLGITRAAYTNLENGKRQCDPQTLIKLADLYHVSVGYLIGHDTDEEQPHGISVISSSTIAPHQKDLLNAYEALSDAEQQMLCRMLGITHPADERSKASKA